MRILLADDQALFRAGLACMLQRKYGELEVVEASVFSKVMNVMKLAPEFDLMVLDLKIPGSDGAISIKLFHQRYPDIPLVVVTEAEDRRIMEQSMEYGAMGFVCKSSTEAEFLKAVGLVLQGDLYISPKTLRRDPMAAARSSTLAPVDRRRQNTNEYGLTERQMQILQYLSAGLSNREISVQMSLAEGTVKVHVAAAYQMLRVNSRSEAVRVAEQLGLIEVPHG
jgi:DNA-binding NarL/FixJ family response regulator